MRKKETDLKIIQDRYNKRLEYQNTYNKTKYDHISVIFPAGAKNIILEAAKNRGFKNASDYFKNLLQKDGVIFEKNNTL